MSEPEGTITTEQPDLDVEGLHAWLEAFMQPTGEEKLVLCGPRFMGIATGCYNPKYWPRLRGSAHQRRIKRRHLARMWEVTKDSSLLQDPPSMLLKVF